jgi:uncharacterized protein (DUF2252 family)
VTEDLPDLRVGPENAEILTTIGRAARIAEGKSVRARVKRSTHADVPERPRGFDVVDFVERANADRVPSLVPIRRHRMATSPFMFFRGTAGLMAFDLARTPVTGISVQLSGDAHCGNFGAFATPERNLIFDVRDFDETLPGPWEWDVKRLAASFVLASRSIGGSDADARDAVCSAVSTYRETMFAFSSMSTLDTWYARVDVREILAAAGPKTLRKKRRTYVDGVGRRTIQKAFDDMTALDAEGRRRFVDEVPIVYHVRSDEDKFFDVRELFDAYRESLSPDVQSLFARYTLVDWVVKVVGVGSVGTRCAAALFLADDEDALILQMKEAGPSVLEAYHPPTEYASHGMRVVAGQRIMQAASDLFLGYASEGGRDYYIRQLRDMKGVPDLEDMGDAQLTEFARFCGRTLAGAHARSGKAAQIAGYLGSSDTFDEALVTFAKRYADLVAQDHEAFVDAIESGRLEAKEA